MNKEIDHDYTDEIVCPYCGCEFSDSYEFDDDSGTMECYECEKEFEYYRHIEVTYCTYELTEEMKEEIKEEIKEQKEIEKEFLVELNKDIDESVIKELYTCKDIDDYILKKMFESAEADNQKAERS
jgi:ATP-dependent Zn protease